MILRTVTEAKGQLSALVEAAIQGEEVILSRAGKSVVRIVSLDDKFRSNEPGGLTNLVIPDDFDTTDPEIIRLFEGDHGP